MIKRLVAEQKILWISALLLWVACFAVTVLQLGGVPDSTCFMDAFAAVSSCMRYAIYPIAIFTVVSLIKDEFDISNVLRRKTHLNLWIYLVLKIGVISLLLAIITFLGTSLTGIIIGDSLCNWNDLDSFCVKFTNYYFENVNIVMILLTFFLCIFSGMYVVSMICLSTYWFFNTFVLGAVISLAVCIGGTGLTINYNNYRGVSYDLIDHGIDPRYQYIYPFFIVLILAAVGILKQKRDFIKKAGVEE